VHPDEYSCSWCGEYDCKCMQFDQGDTVNKREKRAVDAFCLHLSACLEYVREGDLWNAGRCHLVSLETSLKIDHPELSRRALQLVVALEKAAKERQAQ